MSGLDQFEPPQYSYDLLAERGLLKIALDGDPHAVQLCGDLVPAFWDHRHALLGAVLAGMLRDRQHIDPVSVLGQLTAQGKLGKVDGPFLHGITSGPGDHSGVVYYSDRIREMHARRRAREVMINALHRMEHGWQHGEDLDVVTAMADARLAFEGVERSLAGPDAVAVQSMAEFLDGPTEEDWLVPGLLERCERIILTGSEGHGKSTLCRQLGACMAGSVHPFSGAVLGAGNRQIRVTVMDCENNPVQARRGFQRVIRQVDRIRSQAGLPRADWKENMHIEIRTEGLDLLDTRDVAHLEHVVAATVPDLVVLGPLYKLFDADPSDERAVRAVSAVLDGLRARHQFALLIEAHPKKGQGTDGLRCMEPIGSSLWMRWPEYGFGIRRARAARGRRPEVVDVVSWRGSREERSWPVGLRHDRRLPWAPVSEAEQAVEDRVAELDLDGEGTAASGWYR
jgi:hypothetical protein